MVVPYKDPARRRQYQNSRSAAAKAARDGITKALQCGVNAPHGLTLREANNPNGEAALGLILRGEGMTILKTLRNIRQLTRAKAFKTVKGELMPVPDNDVRLKANEMVLGIQTRAGLLPSDKQHNGSGNITLNVISYHSPEPQIITINQPTDNTQDN